MKKTLNEFSPNVLISSDTILKLNNNQYENVLWTDDIKQELPIFLGNNLLNDILPTTLIEEFNIAESEEKDKPALFYEIDNKWNFLSWSNYKKQVRKFALSVISLGVEPYQTVNILGFNSPEWLISFFGGIFSCVIPVGLYLTNSSNTCHYITTHSNCGILCVDTFEQYKKYDKFISEHNKLKAIIIWKESEDKIAELGINSTIPLYSWTDFLNIGSKSADAKIELNHRIKMQKSGNCCSIIYTSSTTGNTKAVLLSHDNMIFAGKACINSYKAKIDKRLRIVSYLPLSHIASQIVDIVSKYTI